ncbi:DNA-binding protein [Methylobacterium sp. J-092]|uniref:DNA-binding protein n=1 Tax=Methylobacterium sp. J-092 TaxID=2836667 RepID=UPI001FBB61C3|nr:DNA-binding protein [Methylobacterium sp. J-092]MCJ2007486.1 DNA-binding protein [Methylobacterium sp. J-092]
MPTRKEVFEAADELRAAGERVSLRNVIPRLKWGGSNREVGPLLRDWKAERSYCPTLEMGKLPERLQVRMLAVVGELWEAARTDAARALTDEREALMAERAASSEILDEVLARLDAAESELKVLRGQATRSEARLRRLQAEEFWDRVVREVREIIPENGSLTVGEILPRLRPETVRGAAHHREDMTLDILRKKLDMRASWNKLVTREGKGRYARGPA